MTEISVRLVLTPLKQSRYVVAVSSSISNESVCSITANCSSTLTRAALDVSLSRACRASSLLPRRTSQYGLSGARGNPASNIVGHSHCTAYHVRKAAFEPETLTNGILYAH